MNEIIFLVEESDEGGYIAKALAESIVTQAENKRRTKRTSKKCRSVSF